MPTRRFLLAAIPRQAIPRQALLLLVGLVATSFVLLSAASASTSNSPSDSPSDSALPNGVALCDGQNGRPAHDPTKWHALVERNADGSVLCTYGHEHGMNPATVNDIFGPLPLTQTISYPWATINSAGVAENSVPNKHRVYKWLMARNLACSPDAGPQGSGKAITAFRMEVHADGSLGATARFHSYWIQFELTDCVAGTKGIASFGGHEDYAHLHATDTIVALPVDGALDNCTLLGDMRQEGALNGPEQGQSVWYGSSNRDPLTGKACDDAYGSAGFQVGLGLDQWGPVDPANPAAVLFYPDRESHKGTVITTDALTLWASELPTDPNTGRVNWTGFFDRHARSVSGCTTPGIDCIPASFSNVALGGYGAIFPCPCPNAAVSYDGDVPGPQGQPGFYVQNPETVVSTGPTSTPTAVVAPPTATATATTVVQPTATSTNVVPTATRTAVSTNTPVVAPTNTPTTVVVPTNTPKPVTSTPTSGPTRRPTRTPIPTRTHIPTVTPTPHS